MTQIDALADALAATSVHKADGTPESSTEIPPAIKAVRASFASALRSGQAASPSILTRDAAPSTATLAPPALPDATSPAAADSACELVPVDDSILQAIRKRDDRIFFSQYENQMAAFVRDPSRSTLELGAMNTYQRLLIHKCADQFQLDHQLDRATQSITLSRTTATSHPSVLLSVRAREYLVQRDGIDPVNVHPAIASIAAVSLPETSVSLSNSSAPTSSPASPAPPAAAILSPPTNAPKPGFKIMRRDPSSSRHSPLKTIDNDNNDPDKASAKARKDMTLEEREASYKAARARIFGDIATNGSGSASPTSSTPPLDQSSANEQATDTASTSRASPSSSTASSPVASIAGGRSASRTKKASSSSSGPSTVCQDGSIQRPRGNGRNKANQHSAAGDSVNYDLEFSRALPLHSNSTSPSAFGVPQQSSPLALAGHVAQGYFPQTHPLHLQQSHSNPNLRSRAPVFHPQGSSTPAHSQGGALRHPDAAQNGRSHSPQAQRQWSQNGQGVESDAFPALGGAVDASSTPRLGNSRSAGAPGAWNRSQHGNGATTGSAAGQEHLMNGVGVWAQQTSSYAQNNAALRQAQQYNPAYLPYQQQPQQYQQGFQPYQAGQASVPLHYNPYATNNYAAPRSTTSSRASSQRGGGGHGNNRGGARDDAVSVSSISSSASSRSASFSGVSGAGSTNAAQPANGSHSNMSKPVTALAHPSLPARPAWVSTCSSNTTASGGAEGSE